MQNMQRMQKVGRIQSLWRYPVKGMAGEALAACELTGIGLLGDRVLAVQDVKRQEIQSCKFRPELLQCRAEHCPDTGEVRIIFPDGSVLHAGDPLVNNKISALLGHESTLQGLRELTGNEAFYQRYKADGVTWLKELKATFAREQGEPLPDLDNLPQVMQDYVTIPGTFFLVAALHIVTTASLIHMQGLTPQADWVLPRFRPNLVIETLPEYQGLVEQGWLNRTMVVGDIELACVASAPRCGAVVRPQQGVREDREVLRSIVKNAEQNLGAYCTTNIAGEVKVGMDVWLV